MTTRREPGQPQCGEPLGHGGDERLATTLVGRAHPAQVPVVATRLHQPRERQLVESRRAPTGQRLGLDEIVHQVRRREHPADSDARRERLADRPQRDHAVGRQALERADGLAVIAELRVVVVLDDVAVDRPGPGHQLLAALRAEGHPGRALVRRSEHHGSSAGGREPRDVEAVVVDRDRHRLQAEALGDPVVVARAGALQADPLHATTRESREGQRERVPEAGRHHRALRGGGAGPDAAVVRRQHLAQPRVAAVGLVAHQGGRCDAGGLAQRPHPVADRRRGQVRDPVLEVDLDRRLGPHGHGCLLNHRRRGLRALGHPRAGAHVGDEVTLGVQLLVGVDHEAARDPELVGETPRRRQPLPG